MSNILKGIIKLEAPGLPGVASAVSRSVDVMGERMRNAGAAGQSFGVGIQRAETQLKKINPASNQATLALGNLSRVAQDAPYGFIGIANNLNPLLESFQRLRVSTGSNIGALKALGSSLTGAGGIGLALGVASSLAVVFGDRLFGAGKKAKEAEEGVKNFTAAVKGIFADAGREAAEVNGLIAVLKSETETRERKLLAIKELNRIAPETFSNLKLEGNAVSGLDATYQNYLTNLRTVIAAKIKQAQLESLITKQLVLQGATQTQLEKGLFAALEAFNNNRLIKAQGDPSQQGLLIKTLLGNKSAREKELSQLNSEIEAALKDLVGFSSGIKLTPNKTNVKSAKKVLEDIFRQDLKNPIAIPAIFTIEKNYQPQSTTQDSRIKDLTQLGLRPITVPLRLNLSTEVIANRENQARMAAAAKTLSDSFTSALTGALASGLSSVGEGIGNIISGKGFGAGIVNVIGSLLQTLGQALIQYGIVKEGLDKILGPGGIVIPGAVAIGLGVAATAFGQVFKNFDGFRALGGPVSSGKSYIVGENGPELFTAPSNGNIIPNNRLSSYSGGGLFGGMGGQVVFRIGGNELVGVLSLANQSQRRLGG